MKKNGLISLLMSVLLILSMLPSMVFAAELTALEGELKVKGTAEAGSELSADYEKVLPAGMTDDLVSFLWERKISDQETKELSREKSYKAVEEDVGYQIVLTITGREDMGYTGSLTAKTEAIVMPAAQTEEVPQEETSEEYVQTEESAEEEYTESVPEEDTSYEDTSYEDTSYEDTSEDVSYEDAEYEDPGYEEEISESAEDTAADEYDEDLRELTEEEMAELTGGADEEFIEDYENGEMYEEALPEDEWIVEDEVYADEESGTDDAEIIEDPYAEEDVSEENEGSSDTVLQENAVLLEPTELVFTYEDGYFDSSSVTITNVYDSDITVALPVSDRFDISPMGESLTLAPGETLGVFVQPLNAEEPSYSENLQFVIEGTDGTDYVDVAATAITGIENTDPGLGEGEDQNGGTGETGSTGEDPNGGTGETGSTGEDPNGGTGETGSEGEDQNDPGEQTPEETVKPEIQIATADETGVLSFGEADYGYAEIAAQSITLTYTAGTEPVLLYAVVESEEPVPFEVSPETAELSAEQPSAVLNVKPAAGLEAGEYSAVIIIAYQDTEADVEVGRVQAGFKVLEEPNPSLTLVPEDQGALDFGSAEEYYGSVDTQSVVIKNNGNQSLSVSRPEGGSYFIGTPSAEDEAVPEEWPVDESKSLEPEEELTLMIAPMQDLPEGNYDDTLVFTGTAEGAEVPAEVSVEVKFTVIPMPDYTLEISPESLDFGKVTEGYPAVGGQTVTITNAGNQTVNLVEPVPVAFTVELDKTTLTPGDSAKAVIAPKTGLKGREKAYGGNIIFETEETPDEGYAVNVTFTVEEVQLKITKVLSVSPVTGIANGAEKSASGLKLPSVVRISTTKGEMDANVTWDVAGCSYNPSETKEQTFTVNGKVSLPKGVANPGNAVSQNVSVNVTVGAYAPKLASADNNQITGMKDAYAPRGEISFTAVGAGMDNASPRKGDTRFVPVQWSVSNTTKIWEKAPYTGVFGMAHTGDYTLSVLFEQQEYDGTNWVRNGVQDTKRKNFTVTDKLSVTPTPVSQNSNQKNAVQTGDDTNILPFIIALICAAVCVAGIIVYRRRR